MQAVAAQALNLMERLSVELVALVVLLEMVVILGALG